MKRVTMYDYQMHPTASLLSAFLPHDDKEEFVFNNEFHRVVHKFVDSRTFSAFILLTILINTAMLIANTFFVVAVRTGRTYVTSRHVTSRHVTSRHVTSRHVTSRHVTSRHVTSRHVTYNRSSETFAESPEMHDVLVKFTPSSTPSDNDDYQ